jgi:hypothetical protein
MNPIKEKGIPLEKQVKPWKDVNVAPYHMKDVHPYTRCRVIVMNGTEIEAVFHGHAFHRHITDQEARRQMAMCRMLEQQQQKMVNWLIPGSETVIETTIGYEQVAVDLTAGLAKVEPDPMVKAALDFALLEDFDHLYRYANLMEMTIGKKAEEIVGDLTEITPGRPTILEHRHPFDNVRGHIDGDSADLVTQLGVNIIVAAEQQTMNFYMNAGAMAEDMVGRGLYQEIAMVEEEHVTHYGSLLDPSQSMYMMNVMHQYTEAYLYWSFAQDEVDNRIKSIWERHLDMEIGHLHAAIEMMKKFERKDPTAELDRNFPKPFKFESNVDYVRDILATQVDLTADMEKYVPVSKLPKGHRYHMHQEMVNEGGAPSVEVIEKHIEGAEMDYRLELAGEHPVKRFRERRKAA